jgi:hypothetical protein
MLDTILDDYLAAETTHLTDCTITNFILRRCWRDSRAETVENKPLRRAEQCGKNKTN